MLRLLMMQLEKLRFIAFKRKLMSLTLLGNGKIWSRMRWEKYLSVSDQTMEENTAARSLKIIVDTMGFVERIKFQEHHKKMVR
jgi:hypothetical protein